MAEMETKKAQQLNGQVPPAADSVIEDIPVPAQTVKKTAAGPAPVKKPAGSAPVKSTAKPAGSAPVKSAAKPAGSAPAKSAAKPAGIAPAKSTAKPAGSAAAKAPVRKPAAKETGGQKTLEDVSKAVSAGMKKTGDAMKKAFSDMAEKRKERPAKKPLSKKARLRRKKRIRRYIRRTLLCLLSILLVAVFGVYMVLLTVFHGPSQTASDLLVNTVMETSALKFVPYIFFSDEEVEEILARNAVVVTEEETDTSLVVIDRTLKEDAAAVGGEEEKDIELVEVNGSTYHGYMLIVKDPSRVSLAVCDESFSSDYGKYLDELAEENGAIAAINAGGFSDEGGGGRGGKPLGIVIKDGKVLHAKSDPECDVVIGFDQDDKLIVGEMSADKAKELNIRDAAAFDPVLIRNGEPASIKGSSSGLNPRTAIGQRADGAVLLLVIDGRQVNSMGASLADLIDVMMQFGAVNAANLDGGSSSKMYYNGEFVNDGVALTGSRRIPTAFIVK